MPTYTPEYNLPKPGGNETQDVAVLGEAMDKIDAALYSNATNIGLLKNASGRYAMIGVGISPGRAFFVVNFPSPPPWYPAVTEFNVTNIGAQTSFTMSTSGLRLRIDTTNAVFVEGKAYHADAVLTF